MLYYARMIGKCRLKVSVSAGGRYGANMFMQSDTPHTPESRGTLELHYQAAASVALCTNIITPSLALRPRYIGIWTSQFMFAIYIIDFRHKDPWTMSAFPRSETPAGRLALMARFAALRHPSGCPTLLCAGRALPRCLPRRAGHAIGLPWR
eukprot:5989713-Prymnesium_polylepis.1